MPTKQPPKRQLRPRQTQSRQPGLEADMRPLPEVEQPATPQGKLAGKVAVISGGDSGIGRAVAVAMAVEGADIAILYLDEHQDAKDTAAMVEAKGRRCLTMATDLGLEKNCVKAIAKVISKFEHIDIVVNNAAEQHPQESLLDITAQQLEKTFRTNIFSYFYLTKAALPHLHEGAAIINTSSVTAYRGSAQLLDYSATKGAIVAFTRSLAIALAKDKIRVNGVAPGPVWTPLIPSTFPAAKVATFGSDVPLARASEPAEIAPCYVFLASEDASYMTGQFLHPNGGEVVNA
jgi:NAD(P)-dependent dehydrogenase (short-subunit alcohol dehydrogenase family)